MIKMQAPQIIYLVVSCLALGINIAKHGEPKNENYSAITSFIGAILTLALMYWGGFFT